MSVYWQKCFGDSINDEANSIQQTTDGGYYCNLQADDDIATGKIVVTK
ncbi:MAG: hypothetical protein Q8T08_14430 [Ignavibacteria bacterium]|nr:hypothetical protein [Ignavibacteria bacterium]